MILKSLIGQITLGLGTVSLTATTLVAFNIVPLDLPEYKIVTVVGNGQPTLTFTSEPGNPIIVPEPYVDGYFFLGWYTDTTFSTLFKERKMPRNDLFLYAGWRKIDLSEPPVISIRDDLDLVVYEGIIGEDIRITPKEKEGLVFDNFYQDFETTKLFTKDKLDTPTENIYIRYVPDYKPIVYFLNGGRNSVSSPTQYIFASDPAGYNVVNPIRPGYAFEGWFDNQSFLGNQITLLDTRKQSINLYAKWKLKQYQLQFFGFNDAVLASYDLNYDQVISDEMIPSPELIAAGFVFVDWSQIIPSTMPDSDLIIRAIYSADIFNIEFIDILGNSIINFNYKFNQSLSNLEIPEVAEISGFTFVGWSPQIPTTMPARNLVFIPQYNRNSYNVTFNLNNGANPVIVELFEGSILNPISTPTRAGHNFIGWYLESSLSNQYNFNVQVSSSFNLYAKWEQISLGIPITFNANGADSGTMTDQFIDQDQSANLRSNQYSLIGHTFKGWSTSAKTPAEYNSSFIAFADSALFSMTGTSPIILFALWEINNYTLSFDLNYSGAPNAGNYGSITKPYNTNLTTFMPSNPSRTGYTFNGWFEETLGINSYPTSFMPNLGQDGASKTLYAKWLINSYTLTFNTDGGNSIAAITQNYNSVINSPTNPIKGGYSFTGWLPTIPTNMPAANQTYVAQWTINNYTIAFNSNDGSAVASIQAAFGENISAPSNPTKTGFNFGGWYSDFGLTSAYTIPSTMPNLGVNNTTITLYAKWLNQDQYAVVFDGNNSTSGSMSNQSISLNNTVTLTANGFARTGYTFAGWNTVENGSGGTPYANGASFTLTVSNNVTLFAQWTPIQYTLSFNSNGGSTPIPTSKNVTYDAQYGSLPTPTRTGYTLAEWNTLIAGNGVTITASSIVTTASNHTLFAIWTPKITTITLDADLGGVAGTATSPTSVTATFGAVMPSNFEPPTRNNSIFAGFFTLQNGNGIKYINSDKSSARNWDIDEPTSILYAFWTSTETFYTVEYYVQDTDSDEYVLFSSDNFDSTTTSTVSADPIQIEGADYSGTSPQQASADGNILQLSSTYVETTTQWSSLYTVMSFNVMSVSYTVNFNIDGGVGGTGSISVTNGTTMPAATAPTKLNFAFAGYYDDTLTVKYYNSDMSSAKIYDLSSNTTLKAMWIPISSTSTVTLNRNGGSGGTGSLSAVVPGQPMPSATAPTRSSFVFGGYVTNDNGTGDLYYYSDMSSARPYDRSSAITLYAKWVAKPDAISPKPEGETVFKLYYNRRQVTVVYNDLDSGNNLEQVKVENIRFGGSSTPPIVFQSGKKFIGWDGLGYSNVRTRLAINNANYINEIYYINYFLNGGINNANNPSTFSTTPVSISNPTRAGYLFDGWYNTSNLTGQTITQINSSNDIDLYAKWNVETRTINYTVDPNKGIFSGTASQVVNLGSNGGQVSVSARTGYTFSGWSDGISNALRRELNVQNNISVTALFVDNASFLVTFNSNQGSSISNQIVAQGGLVIEPSSNPTRSGYSFDGWYGDFELNTEYDFQSEVTQNLTLYAKWTIYPGSITYTNVFVNHANPVLFTSTDQITFDDPSPRPGYNFVGWFNETTRVYGINLADQSSVDSSGINAVNYTVAASWTPISYTINFDTSTLYGITTYSDSTNISPITYNIETNSFSIKDPANRNGYLFAGWYNSIQSGNQISIIEKGTIGNKTLYAYWQDTNSATITLYANGGLFSNNNSVVTITAAVESTITLPANPTRQGYNFVNWYSNSLLRDQDLYLFENPAKMPILNVSLYAKWEPISYTITYDSASLSGSITDNPISYTILDTLAFNSPSLRQFYIFDGWYENQDLSGSQILSLPTNSTGNKVFYAKWSEEKYSLTLISASGVEEVQPIWVNSNLSTHTFFANSTFIPTTISGYRFVGWVTNRTGTELANYVYSGVQYLADQKMPRSNLTLYAEYSSDLYFITYNTFGGVNDSRNIRSYNSGQIGSGLDLFASSKVGYTFVGWYETQNFTTPIIDSIPGNAAKDYTLYAKYDLITYNIIYNLNGGTNNQSNVSIYNIETPTINLLAPSKDGSIFSGWYLDSQFTIPINSINQGSTGTINLFAKWTPIVYSLKTYSVATLSAMRSFESGLEFSVALTDDYQVYTWGKNNFGQLGSGTFVEKSNIPINITPLFNLSAGDYIKEVKVGANHVVALTNNGQIFAWGQNSLGQVGDGTVTNRYSPVNITSRMNLANGITITKLFTGFNNTWVQTSQVHATVDGSTRYKILGWGYNGFFQIGDGTKVTRMSPVDVSTYLYSFVDTRYAPRTGNFDDKGGHIVKIQGGDGHSALITSNGRVMTWGRNDSNSKLLGYNGGNTPTLFYLNQRYSKRYANKNPFDNGTAGAADETFADIQVGAVITYARSTKNNIFVYGDRQFGQFGNTTTSNANPYKLPAPFELTSGESYKILNNKFYHSIIVITHSSNADRIFIFGTNTYSQTGFAASDFNTSNLNLATHFMTTNERVQSTAIGLGHTGVFLNNGKTYGFGLNTSGQLGNGTYVNKILTGNSDIPNSILGAGTFISLLNEYSFAFGDNISGILKPNNAGTWYTNADLTTGLYTLNLMPANNLVLYHKP